jgi:hypothetical protein
MIPMARAAWEEDSAHAAEHGKQRLDFMTPDHHRVRELVVVELPRRGRPLPVDEIAERLALDVDRTREIVGELEERLVFLVRNDEGEVSWAFPVTVDRTPHRLTFSTGERLHGA